MPVHKFLSAICILLHVKNLSTLLLPATSFFILFQPVHSAKHYYYFSIATRGKYCGLPTVRRHVTKTEEVKKQTKKNHPFFFIKFTLWYFARIWPHALRNLHAAAFLSVYGQGSGSIRRSTRRPKIASLRIRRYGK